MKKIEQYLVEGFLFTDEEFAAKVKPILEAHPELDFVSKGDTLVLPVDTWRGEAGIVISNKGVELQLQTFPYNENAKNILELAGKKVLTGIEEELEEKGISWELFRGVQYFSPKDDLGSLKSDFTLLYKFSEEWK
jgi:hypothetical protein